jgi:tRNA pseudouridine-54 N-methylase
MYNTICSTVRHVADVCGVQQSGYACTASDFTLNSVLVAGNHRNVYRDADKSLARSGRKQVTETEYFDFHISYL